MSNSNFDPGEYEEALSPYSCRTGTGKSTLLATLDILRGFTDESHGLTAGEIASIIGARTGRPPSEGKVLSDIHEIAENRPFGMEVSIPSRGEAGGFRCTKAPLTAAQGRLLLNMARTCKFITDEQRAEVCGTICECVPRPQRAEILGVCTDGREACASSDAFEAADVALRAIALKRMVRFSYVDRDFDGADKPIIAPDGGETFEETPVALVYSFGNYYLETWAEEPGGRGSKMNRRLDRVRRPEVSSRLARRTREVRELRRTVGERTEQVLDMWGDGVPRALFLEVRREVARYVFDRFGASTRFHHVSPDGSTGYTCVVVQLSPTFYRWVFGMGGRVGLRPPGNPGWLQPFWEDERVAAKSVEELGEDYRAAIGGYVGMLRSAIGEYDGVQGERSEWK